MTPDRARRARTRFTLRQMQGAVLYCAAAVAIVAALTRLEGPTPARAILADVIALPLVCVLIMQVSIRLKLDAGHSAQLALYCAAILPCLAPLRTFILDDVPAGVLLLEAICLPMALALVTLVSVQRGPVEDRVVALLVCLSLGESLALVVYTYQVVSVYQGFSDWPSPGLRIAPAIMGPVLIILARWVIVSLSRPSLRVE